jgi:hypothetical protein
MRTCSQFSAFVLRRKLGVHLPDNNSCDTAKSVEKLSRLTAPANTRHECPNVTFELQPARYRVIGQTSGARSPWGRLLTQSSLRRVHGNVALTAAEVTFAVPHITPVQCW